MQYFKGNKFCFELNKKTYIMGILNVTPDSFYDGGKWNSPDTAINHAIQMQKDGADIIDIGAQSTRPGHIELSPEEELNVISQFFDTVVPKINVPVSVDTYYPFVAEYCLKHGAMIINDVSGVFNPKMACLIKKYNAGWIVMHTGGGTADIVPSYESGILNSVNSFFDDIIKKCSDFGIKSSQLCLDMGIGFGKTNDDNLELIRNINKLKRNDIALLTALSNKRVIKNACVTENGSSVFGTIAADTAAIAGGTDIIRVHEVFESKAAALMADKIYRG